MKIISYLKVALATTYNILVNGLTLGREVWLEGRVRSGIFMNWGRRFRYSPRNHFLPSTEDEIVATVKRAKSVRLYGSGHSFNGGVVADDTLVSLDRYSGVLWKNPERKQIAVKAGMRVRDLVGAMRREGLAFAALPSHDAQSMGGILSTDVHGTGRKWGFVSQSIEKLKLIDGRGQVVECDPSDDLFKAAIGGIGAVGIITEVVVQGVDRFNVEQKTQVSSLTFVQKNLDRLLHENDHFSLYLFPFTDNCQINTWNRTDKRKTFLGSVKEFASISADALLAAWVGNLLAYLRLLPAMSGMIHRIKRGTNLVLESNAAFNRTIYHLHQELEFTVPFEDTFPVCRQFIDLYEEMYADGLPYTIFEIRFTPPGHDRTLLGAGQETRCSWIDLVCNDSDGFEKYYAAAVERIKKIGARPHLGKYCEGFDKEYLARFYPRNFLRFQQLRNTHDPEGKFTNEFTRRVFGNGPRQVPFRDI